MKKYFVIFIFALINCLTINCAFSQTKVIEKLWNEVKESTKNKKPVTTMNTLSQIYDLASTYDDLDNMIKSKYYLLALNMTQKAKGAKTDKDAHKIFLKEYRKEYDEAIPKLKPFYKLLLANWYWSYYMNESARISKRTRLNEYNDEDISTWDLTKLFSEINKCYQELLENEEELKSIYITELRALLDFGNLHNLRPTLFDFFCHEALKFYCDETQNQLNPSNAFEIKANGPALKNYAEFANWNPKTTDIETASFQAVKIFQRLIKHNLDHNNINAYIDNEIIRLEWAYKSAVGENARENYITALENLANEYPKNDYSGIALAKVGIEYKKSGDYVKALDYAEKVNKQFNVDKKFRCCVYMADNLKHDILHQTIKVETEKINLPGKVQARISYRNANKLYFRLYRRSEDEILNVRNDWDIDRLNNVFYKSILSKPPEKEWNVSLEETKDYKERIVDVDLPINEKGLYYLFTSINPDFNTDDLNYFSYNLINCSNLNFFYRNSLSRSENNEIIVVDNVSGNPIKDAEVEIYHLFTSDKTWHQIANGKTDGKGFFTYPSKLIARDYCTKNILVKIRYENDFIYGSTTFNPNSGYFSPYRSDRSAVLFTDRSIYRPGQTIYFKGIGYKYDTEKNEYKTCGENLPVSVFLSGVDSSDVSAVSLTTNRFGSFNGSFTIPTDVLNGEFSINASIEDKHNVRIRGRTEISVEDYKRPKFRVELSNPKKEYKLNDDVTLDGTAIGFNGTFIDDAKVKYRVTRKVRYPIWRWWIINNSKPLEISHGETKTDGNGKFNIQFPAIPDKSVNPDAEPMFYYEVSADVTDKTGETRSSSKSIRLAYKSIDQRVNCPKENEANQSFEVNIKTLNLNYEPISTNGYLEIYSLKQPNKPVRKGYFNDEYALKHDQSDPRNWNKDQLIKTIPFITTDNGESRILCEGLKEGVYKLITTTKDKDNKDVVTENILLSIDSKSDKFNIKIPFYTKTECEPLQPGDTYEAVWATGYDEGPAFIEVECKGNLLQSYWTDKPANKAKIIVPISEDMRGGFAIRILQFKDNREYTITKNIPVEWNNKNLNLRFSSMRSKLEPGQTEVWKLEITGDEAYKNAIELVAAMYDKSLDEYKKHDWLNRFSVFYNNRAKYSNLFIKSNNMMNLSKSGWPSVGGWENIYPYIQNEILNDIFYIFGRYRVPVMLKTVPTRVYKATAPKVKAATSIIEPVQTIEDILPEPKSDKIDLSDIKARSDFSETAFFYPNLIMNDENSVTIEFKIPESLTTWKFMGFAHGNNLQSGSIIAETITQKDIMIEPNLPRFLREGDKIVLSAKITNLTNESQKGKVSLEITDPASEKSLNKEFKVTETLDFNVESHKSTAVSWVLNVPDSLDFNIIKYKVVGSTGLLSDGEEGYLPILSRYVQIIESIPMPINGPCIKSFNFDKLKDSAKSSTLKHKALTLEVTSNPAWYAIQALPYLIEYPHECSEQLFNRYYANLLAHHISSSNPLIKKVFETWKKEEESGHDILISNLEKNPELKNIVLQETPWLRNAAKEKAQKHRIGLLFDENNLNNELSKCLKKLKERQNSDGGFSWFPGDKSSDFITLYIMTGFARLKNLGVNVDMSPAIKAISYLDNMVIRWYEESIKNKRNDDIYPAEALYLYGRTFFWQSNPLPDKSMKAFNYFMNLAKKYWHRNSRMTQAHIALALNRLNDKEIPAIIAQSLMERSTFDEEMGRFWQDTEFSLSWFRADIETQAMMIEVFSELSNDEKTVDECKIWLIKQKQTQNWKSTKATADAIYSLIIRGTDILSSNKLVTAEVGNVSVEPERAEAGTGYYKKVWSDSEITPDMGSVILNKQDKGVAYGAMHWQYLEDISKVTSHENNLKLEKTLYIKRNTDKGPTLFEVKNEKIKIGDLLTVRIVLRTDRDMEFVHMKDNRGSGLEPVNVISRRKYQDGLSYYETTKDTATNFFIDYLAKGTYVFEYDLRVQHAGKYQSGLAEIQCMYAPEFNSHSNSVLLNVTK